MEFRWNPFNKFSLHINLFVVNAELFSMKKKILHNKTLRKVKQNLRLSKKKTENRTKCPLFVTWKELIYNLIPLKILEHFKYMPFSSHRVGFKTFHQNDWTVCRNQFHFNNKRDWKLYSMQHGFGCRSHLINNFHNEWDDDKT